MPCVLVDRSHVAWLCIWIINHALIPSERMGPTFSLGAIPSARSHTTVGCGCGLQAVKQIGHGTHGISTNTRQIAIQYGTGPELLSSN